MSLWPYNKPKRAPSLAVAVCGDHKGSLHNADSLYRNRMHMAAHNYVELHSISVVQLHSFIA